MDLTELKDHFAIPGVLSFDQHNGLTRANITTPAAKATVYLQGAHLTAWQPTGQQPVIFLSRKSDFVPGKPIRGGVPIASETPLNFEEAMHTYFAVVDVHEVTVTGLEPTPFVDKTDNMREKPAANAPLTFTTFTDRVYPNTTATCVIHDAAGRRNITVAKTNSNTTVVFNPWKEMPDMGPDEWHEMLCVETVNAATNAVTLATGKTHTMQAHITVEGVKA